MPSPTTITSPVVITAPTILILHKHLTSTLILVRALMIMFTMTEDLLIYTIVMEEPGAISLEAVPIIITAIQIGLALLPSVLVSARTTIVPGAVVFPEADENAAAIGTTRAVSVTRIVLIRCGVVASMIILDKIRDRSGSTREVCYLNSH